MASRDEEELKRTRGGRLSVVGDDGVHLLDNGAFSPIEDNYDPSLPVDVEETPYLPAIVDDDGFPGYRPAVEASLQFEQVQPQPDPDETFEDEFEERLDEHEQAKQDVLGEDGDLAVLARRDHIRNSKLRARAPWSRINPESAYSALLGGQQSLAPGQAPIMVARWEGENVEACPVSVVLSPTQGVNPATQAPGNPYRPFARIQFGTRDSLSTVDIDLGSGVQLTLPASVIYVYLGLDANSVIGSSLTAGIGFYTIERSTQIHRTSYIDGQLPTAGGDVTVPRPSFAQSVSFYRTDHAAAYTLLFLDVTGQTVYAVTLAGGADFLAPIELAGDVLSVKVQYAGAGTSNSRLIWNLGI